MSKKIMSFDLKEKKKLRFLNNFNSFQPKEAIYKNITNKNQSVWLSMKSRHVYMSR